MKIYILRHEDRTMDATFFSPLTKEGLDSSVKLIEVLKKEGIDKIYSSPFIRTLQTIYPYSKTIDKKINIDYSLSEIQHPHIIPEKSYQVTLPLYLSESFNCNDKYTSLFNPTDYSYPENEKVVEKRVKRFINKIITDEFKSDHNIVIVTHQIVCNILLQLANKLNKDIHIDSAYNYPKGGLTQILDKKKWIYKPINWEYKNTE
jgi:2,3-bisphosphoglycerate-dependent phosphoglycerate mutase